MLSKPLEYSLRGSWCARMMLPERRGAAQLGFTLIETMVVVAIIGILAAISAPSFVSMLRSNRLSGASSALQVSFSLARSEAIKRGADTLVTVAAIGAAGHFENGWVVFVDKTGNANGGIAPTADSATVTRIENVAAPATPISFLENSPANSFTYNGQGRINSYGSLWFYDSTSDRYCLVIAPGGRVRVARSASAVNCPSA